MGPIWGSGRKKQTDLLSIPQFAFFMEAGPHTHLGSLINAIFSFKKVSSP